MRIFLVFKSFLFISFVVITTYIYPNENLSSKTIKSKVKKIIVLPFINEHKNKEYDFLSSHIPHSIYSGLYSKYEVKDIDIEKINANFIDKYGKLDSIKENLQKIIEYGRNEKADFVLVGKFLVKENEAILTTFIIEVKTGKVIKKFQIAGESGVYIYDLIDKIVDKSIIIMQKYVAKRKKGKKKVKKNEYIKGYMIYVSSWFSKISTDSSPHFYIYNYYSDIKEVMASFFVGTNTILYHRYIVGIFLGYSKFPTSENRADTELEKIKITFYDIYSVIIGFKLGYSFSISENMSLIAGIKFGFGRGSLKTDMVLEGIIQDDNYVEAESDVVYTDLHLLFQTRLYSKIFIEIGIGVVKYNFTGIKGKDKNSNTAYLMEISTPYHIKKVYTMLSEEEAKQYINTNQITQYNVKSEMEIILPYIQIGIKYVVKWL